MKRMETFSKYFFDMMKFELKNGTELTIMIKDPVKSG